MSDKDRNDNKLIKKEKNKEKMLLRHTAVKHKMSKKIK